MTATAVHPGKSNTGSTAADHGDVLGPVRGTGPVQRVAREALALLAEAERCRAEAIVALGEVDGSGLAQLWGYTTTERMVAHSARMTNREGRDLVAVACHVANHPATGEALASGLISVAQAVILARTARGVEETYCAYEARLIEACRGRDADGLERLCRRWRNRIDSERAADDSAHAFDNRGVYIQQGLDGSCKGTFSLDAVGAETLLTALETRPDPVSCPSEPRSLAQRRADKLVDICRLSLDDTGTGGTGSGATVDVMIDVETLAGNDPESVERLRSDLVRGGPIAGPGLDRLLCDASFRALITDGPRTVLAYNRATPDIPPALRRVIQRRDRHCQFSGCDRPWNWCDLHHIQPRHRGGTTDHDNLVLLCRFHHGCVHDGGWQLTRAPNGQITVRSP